MERCSCCVLLVETMTTGTGAPPCYEGWQGDLQKLNFHEKLNKNQQSSETGCWQLKDFFLFSP